MLFRHRNKVHLIRNTFRHTSRKYWDEIRRDVKPIYTAVNATAARSAFDELADKWGSATQRSSGSGTTRGPSSSRSWTTRRYVDRVRACGLDRDGGACQLEPTTIIDLSGSEPVLVRQGLGDAAPFGL